MSAIEIHGYAIVSNDGRIADASGAMPASLRNEADWRYFQDGLDRADLVALGRRSHEAAPNPRGRRRLIVSGSIGDLEHRSDGLWWNPSEVDFAIVVAALLPNGGRIAVPGGQGVFNLFLARGYTAFHLACAQDVSLPGGRGLFPCVEHGEPFEADLVRAGLLPGTTSWLDEEARVSLTVFEPRRP